MELVCSIQLCAVFAIMVYAVWTSVGPRHAGSGARSASRLNPVIVVGAAALVLTTPFHDQEARAFAIVMDLCVAVLALLLLLLRWKWRGIFWLILAIVAQWLEPVLDTLAYIIAGAVAVALTGRWPEEASVPWSYGVYLGFIAEGVLLVGALWDIVQRTGQRSALAGA